MSSEEYPFDKYAAIELYNRVKATSSCLLDILEIVLKTSDPETKQQALKRFNDFALDLEHLKKNCKECRNNVKD
jgi:hypothetical protein